MAQLKFTNTVWLLIAISTLVNFANVKCSTEYNRYLAHIFHKYGNGGTMSFEGLEHLMYSLGLGQLEFEGSHTIDEHHPNGFEQKLKDRDEIKSYMDIQTIKLVADQDDVQIAQKKSQKRTNEQDKDIILEFKEMHDPKHRHPRENDATIDGGSLASNACLSPKSILRLVVDHDDLHKGKLYKTFTSSASTKKMEVNNYDHDLEEEYNRFINNVRLTPVAFMKLCPALLAQIDQQVCIQPVSHLAHADDTKGIQWNVWVYASASIFILSACGLLGILLVPLMKTVAYQEILNFLVAVAVGTLSGDALMHLIPHALASQQSTPEAHQDQHKDESSHKHDTSVIWICACAFFAALFMFIIETILPLLKGDSSEGSHGHSHYSSHSHMPSQKSNDMPNINKQMSNLGTMQKTSDPPSAEVRELNIMLNEAKLDMKKPSRPLTPVAFMVVIGDGLHNLTDGLAIGAAFANDPVIGLATAFAVLCHELPHELGDFALLLQTGVSIRRAICLNIVSSILSFIGMAIGLLIANLHTNMTQWIYAGTAGSFLYIAFADLVPAMAQQNNGKLKSSLVQVLGIVIGGLIMLLIAVNEDELGELFK